MIKIIKKHFINKKIKDLVELSEFLLISSDMQKCNNLCRILRKAHIQVNREIKKLRQSID